MKVAYTLVSFRVFVNYVAFFSGDPQGSGGMLPDLGGEEKRKRRAVCDGCGWPASSLGLCRSTELLIWFGSSLQSHTNEYSMVGTLEQPLMYDIY